MNPLRRAAQRVSTRVYRPGENLRGFSWVPLFPRVAIGALPIGGEAEALPGHGFTHVINCRKSLQNVLSQDLWIERQVLGPERVAHADMWDHGDPQREQDWVPAVMFGHRALAEDPQAKVLVHCQQGRRRSLFVAYAILRLNDFSPEAAAAAVMEARPLGFLVPAYRDGVERWLEAAASGTPVGDPEPLR